MKNLIMKSLMILMVTCMSSCTYNISMAHTEGTADDVIDDTATNTPNLSPTITIPLSPTGL